MELRPYQREAVNAVYQHLQERDDNPCVVLPTGTGKSLVLGQIAMDAATLWGGRVLILAHVKELLEQNAAKLKALCPELNVGIHSAGLGQRDRDNPVLVAGIQSVYQRAGELGPFDLIIIDEAHLLPPDGEGMYRTFIADALAINPALRIIGLTATPFRIKGGVICKPENLLNAVCYEAGLKEMIAQGYLSPLRARGGAVKADLDSISIRGGEFVAGEAESVMNSGYLVRAACEEIVELTADRNSVLIFCTGVTHCQHVAKEIRRISGQECGIVTGDTSPEDRAEILARFKGEVVPSGLFEKKPPLKYLANVNVLTTGFDATNTDCVALLRPTNSPGLLVQMVGRGTRLHPGKQDCLILDYGGNILRHGPVDAIQARDESDGIATVPAKECPECHALIHLGYTVCPECGYAFPIEDAKDKHDSKAADLPVLTGQTVDTEYPVMSVRYMVHQKRGADPDAPRSMRVEYRIGWQLYLSEWVCFEHTGFALVKAEDWWTRRSNMPVPETAYDAVELANLGALCETKAIKVRRVAGEKYDRIIAYELGPRPEDIAVPVAQDDFSDFNGGPFEQLDDSDDIPF